MDRSRALRLLGALLVLVGGAVHLKLQLVDDYGPLDIRRAFALNAAVSGLVAAYLVLRDDVVGPLAGIAVSVGTLLAFGLSRTGDGILEFRETGLNPAPDALLTVVVEVAAIVVLAIVAAPQVRALATSSPRS
jgi:hypothetical protein